jgi:hypothetical protein
MRFIIAISIELRAGSDRFGTYDFLPTPAALTSTAQIASKNAGAVIRETNGDPVVAV